MASAIMATQMAGPAKSESLRTASMPRESTRSCANESTRKQIHPSVDRPTMEFCVRALDDGTSLMTSSMTAAEAR